MAITTRDLDGKIVSVEPTGPVEDDVSSAEAATENRGASQLVGSDAVVRTAVPVAEILRDEMDDEIAEEEAIAAWQRDFYMRPDLAAKHDARAKNLRRQMEEWNLRQPPSNMKVTNTGA